MESFMRASLIAIVVLSGTLIVAVGCSQSTSPTMPTPAPSITESVTSSLALSAAAPKQVPFKGTLQGHDVDTGFTPTTVTVASTGTGNGSHLGRFSFTQEVTVN